jgi:hypothetical protein
MVPQRVTDAVVAWPHRSMPSLQARHEKHDLLFFTESLLLLQCWHCHEAARAEANLSILGIPPRIGSGGWRKIWEEKTVLFQSVELTCAALSKGGKATERPSPATRPQESLAKTDVRNSFGGTYLLAHQRSEGIITNAPCRNSKKLDNTKTPLAFLGIL